MLRDGNFACGIHPIAQNYIDYQMSHNHSKNFSHFYRKIPLRTVKIHTYNFPKKAKRRNYLVDYTSIFLCSQTFTKIALKLQGNNIVQKKSKLQL